MTRVESDMKIELERSCDLLAAISTHRFACHTPQRLAEQVSQRERMVAVLRARFPPRGLGGERRRHGFPLHQRVGRQRLAHRRKSCAMTENVSDRKPFLPCLRELRPVARYRCVEVDFPALDQPMNAGRGDALGGRIDVYDRVAFPWARACLVGMTAPQVDHRTAVDKDRCGGADIAALIEVLRKSPAHALETRIAFSLDSWHRSFLLAALRLLSLVRREGQGESLFSGHIEAGHNEAGHIEA